MVISDDKTAPGTYLNNSGKGLIDRVRPVLSTFEVQQVLPR